MSEIKQLSNMSNFHPLEVVERSSETQFQVGENLYRLTKQELILIIFMHRWKTVKILMFINA